MGLRDGEVGVDPGCNQNEDRIPLRHSMTLVRLLLSSDVGWLVDDRGHLESLRQRRSLSMDQVSELLVLLRAALELADQIGDHVVAANISHPLALVEQRLVGPSAPSANR